MKAKNPRAKATNAAALERQVVFIGDEMALMQAQIDRLQKELRLLKGTVTRLLDTQGKFHNSYWGQIKEIHSLVEQLTKADLARMPTSNPQ